MTDTVGWREQYMTRLNENPDGWSYTLSVTILQELLREIYEEVHGVKFVPTAWQANVPGQYLSSKGLAAVSSWLRQRIEALTCQTTYAG